MKNEIRESGSEGRRLEIREWTAADLETIRRLTWTTWLDAYGTFIPEKDLKLYFDAVYSVEELTRLQESPHFRGLLAEMDRQAAGYAKVRYAPEEARCYVSSLYILPEFQGMGVGNVLLEEAERRALAFGVKEIWLGVMVQNTKALEWYLRKGFVFVEEQPFTMGSTSVPHRIGYRPIHL